ncbi:DinB family protein [Tundrisphaera lichenicola]|uniref:DinB family protein n=1 Tax=Tundrisphaera lichenicola TaxID=2029860 RepID=UPI003EBF91A2
MDRSWIEQFEAGAVVPASAIRGLNDEDLDARPIAGTWSIREIVVHLMDSDLVGSERMKRVIAMDEPALIGYDENAFVRSLDYGSTDLGLATEVFSINRILTARILRGLPDEAFARIGHHSERGVESLADLVEGYVGHLEHHMVFLRKKRELLGKPLIESL